MIRRVLVPVVCLSLLSSCSSQGGHVTRDTHERLNGVLWMQTSAEYQALALTTFRQATNKVLALKKAVDAGKVVSSAAIEQPGHNTAGLPPVVIVDIDETILDNSPMSAELVEHRVGWDDALWTRWVKMRRADFIAGAEDFVEKVRSAGVEVYFVTNRKKTEEAATIDDLKPLVVTDAEILSSKETDIDNPKSVWENEKSERRSWVARHGWILAMVGDDLADFIPNVREGISGEARLAAMKKNLARFGEQWFLLPNPIYGSWESTIVKSKDSDAEQLADKHRHLRRFPSRK
jgi:acid phosphatase